MKISSKNQVSIPKKILDALNLKSGDEIEFVIEGNGARLIPIKTIKVPRDQAWYWTSEWQEKEKEADLELSKGQYKDFDTLEGLLKDLHGDN
jgi:AbrB family looped-hinge helix DNA binding protein